jgi:hypothetical protein
MRQSNIKKAEQWGQQYVPQQLDKGERNENHIKQNTRTRAMRRRLGEAVEALGQDTA